MSTFQDRQRQYQQVDLPAAYQKHVADGIRKRFADDYDMSGLSDQEVIQHHRDRFADMDPNTYESRLDKTYAHDFTPPPPPTETLGEHVDDFVGKASETAKAVGEGMLPFLSHAAIEPTAKAAIAGGSKLGMAALKKTPIIGQAGFLVGHAANAAVDAATANQLAQTQASIPVPKIDELTENYYQKLQTLKAKGFTDEQIRQEARRRAQNVMHGYEQTTDSLDQDVMNTQANASITEPARAATDAFFLGIGAPQIEKVIGKSLARIGLTSATNEAVGAAAKPAVGALSRIASHVRAGVVVGTPGMAIQGGIEEALQATAQDKTPQEIGQALVHGTLRGGKQGFIGGALIGGGAGALAEGVGAVTRPILNHVSDVDKSRLMQWAAQDAETQSMVKMNAARRAASIDRTARDFNPHNVTIPLDGDSADIATQYIAQRHGDDAVRSEVGMRAASQIARNIELYREAEATLNPTTSAVPMGPDQGRLSGVQPVGEDIHPEGGTGPEVAPESVQGPTGERFAPFQPPTENIPQMTDENGNPILEGNAPRGQAQEPLNIVGPQPEEGQPPAVKLTQPIDVTGAGPGPVAEEIHPREPGKTTEPITKKAEEKPTPKEKKTVPPGEPGEQMSLFDQKLRGKKAAAKPVKPVPVAENAPSPTAGKEPVPAMVPRLETQTAAEGTQPAVTPPAAATSPPAPAEGTPASASTPETAPAPQQPASRAQEAINNLSHLAAADLEVTPEGDLRIARLSKAGRERGQGDTSQAVDQIIKEADRNGVRVVADLVPPPGVSGGRIPLEKVIPWYEARGFKVVESTRIPEGQLSTAKIVREPIGEHQNAVAQSLEKAAADARSRLNSKLGKMNAGFDPSMIGDAAIELAADAFSKRIRGKDAMAQWAVEKWGEEVRPFIDKIITKAGAYFTRMFQTEGRADENLRTLLDLGQSGSHGMDWYEETADWAKQRFGQDADMFLRFLAVTSANGSTEAGSALALKAFSQWKLGMPFEGMRGDSMVGQLNEVRDNIPLEEHSKIANFLDALRGNPEAVVLDRWMLDALNLHEKGGNLAPIDYRIYAKVVKDLATANNMSPRQFQAAVWEGARVRTAHERWREDGPKAVSKLGSARPLEDLVERKLGGMTPEEYAQSQKDPLQLSQNIYQSLRPIRNSILPIEGKKANGHRIVPDAITRTTIDPYTYLPAQPKGTTVPLVSHEVPRGELYPDLIEDFKKHNKELLDELEKKGYSTTLGIRREDVRGKPTGNFFVDINLSVANKQKALTLGKLMQNKNIYSPKGQAIETGFSGKKPTPPMEANSRQLSQWSAAHGKRALAMMQKAGLE